MTTTAGEAAPAATTADEALVGLFRAHYGDLLGLAVVLTGDRPAAEDLVQDAFAQMVRRWGRLREPDRALAYLRTSVANGARSRGRRLVVARRHATTYVPDAASAEEGAVTAAEHDDVLRALRGLPRRQRQVLALRFYADLDDATIAGSLGIAQSSVRVHAHRGLATLTTMLEGTR